MADPPSSRDDAFSRVSRMPAIFFETTRRRYPEHDVDALRVFLALRTAARRVDTVVSGWLVRGDMTLTKFDVLHLVASAPGGTTIGQLHELLSMTQPNVTFVVRGLEREGLVRRETDPADRRSSRVSITAAGLARIDEMTPSHLVAIAGALAGVDASERERLIDVLARIAEGFEAVAPPADVDGATGLPYDG